MLLNSNPKHHVDTSDAAVSAVALKVGLRRCRVNWADQHVSPPASDERRRACPRGRLLWRVKFNADSL
eukprot:2480461-Prymnesium_polylepis.1